MVFVIIYCTLLSMALISGFSNCWGWSLSVEINTLRDPHFMFGIDYHVEVNEHAKVWVLCLGFVLFNVNVTFYKNIPITDEEREEIIKMMRDITKEAGLKKL